MSAKVEVVHASSPLCSWSWGYEPIINRLELVYGDQIEITVGLAVPYVDREQWLKDYDMTDKEAIAFEHETVEASGIPTWIPPKWSDLPASCLPPTLAVKAAGIVHGPDAERRLLRKLQFAQFAEGRDTAIDAVITDVIRKAGLDAKAIAKVASDEQVERALEHDAHKLGHGANFFSLLVRNGEDTTVALERAYDPARVESAIDWLAGKLKKSEPRDVVGYVKEHGPVSLPEVQKVFALTEAKAKALLAEHEKKGVLVHRDYPSVKNGRFWATE